MNTVEQVAGWIGQDVLDRDGEKVGKLEDVYYDTTDHSAAFLAVKSGTFSKSHAVAPLADAVFARDHVRLPASKEAVKGAPQDTSGGRLTGIDAVAVLRHFGQRVTEGLEGESRIAFQTAAAEEEAERKRAEVAALEQRPG